MNKCCKCGQFGHPEQDCDTKPRSVKGQDNGGIRNLAGIKDRCRIDDETGCWIWTGAASNTAASAKNAVPIAWSPLHRKLMPVARLAIEFSRGITLGKRMVWRECRNKDCVNPKHLKFGTRQQWGEWLVSTGAFKGRSTPSVHRAARTKRGDVHLTMELAQWARESPQTGVEVAHALGCSAQQVSKLRRMETWKPSAVGASVFSWAQMAANESRRAA